MPSMKTTMFNFSIRLQSNHGMLKQFSSEFYLQLLIKYSYLQSLLLIKQLSIYSVSKMHFAVPKYKLCMLSMIVNLNSVNQQPFSNSNSALVLHSRDLLVFDFCSSWFLGRQDELQKSQLSLNLKCMENAIYI